MMLMIEAISLQYKKNPQKILKSLTVKERSGLWTGFGKLLLLYKTVVGTTTMLLELSPTKMKLLVSIF